MEKNYNYAKIDWAALYGELAKRGVYVTEASKAIGYGATYLSEAKKRDKLREGVLLSLCTMYGIKKEDVLKREPVAPYAYLKEEKTEAFTIDDVVMELKAINANNITLNHRIYDLQDYVEGVIEGLLNIEKELNELVKTTAKAWGCTDGE